jgi:hypothetical protein
LRADIKEKQPTFEENSETLAFSSGLDFGKEFEMARTMFDQGNV